MLYIMSLQIKSRLNTLEATQSELLDLKADKAFTHSKITIDEKIDNLVNHAPLELNTLRELAQTSGSDANFSTTIMNSISTKAPLSSPTFSGYVGGITKEMVQLDKVDRIQTRKSKYQKQHRTL